ILKANEEIARANAQIATAEQALGAPAASAPAPAPLIDPLPPLADPGFDGGQSADPLPAAEPPAQAPIEAAPAPAPQRITADQAVAAALAYVGGGTVERVKLEQEHGALVYEVRFTNDNRVYVDPASGAVVYAKLENAPAATAGANGDIRLDDDDRADDNGGSGRGGDDDKHDDDNSGSGGGKDDDDRDDD
ncbi:MAG TPA: PepSY domain-containing protein, partial [Herpetosiphonaceae bacterium]